MTTLTTLIRRAQQGDETARDVVFEQLHVEIRKIAKVVLARGGRNTLLDTHALINESFLRLVRAGEIEVKDRSHYLGYASRVMRSVVVDFVRARSAARRGSGRGHVTLNTELAENLAASEDELLRVHEALDELEKIDARAMQVVEMRYFGGLKEEEVAMALGVSERTVRRMWEKARLLLAAALAPADRS